VNQETILNYSIGIAHYTIAYPIKSPSYSNKNYYHRMINLENLFKCEFVKNDLSELSKYKMIFEVFNYDLPNIEIIHYSSNLDKNKKISGDFIKLLYENVNLYNKMKYYISEYKTFEDFSSLFTIDSFHHFIFVEYIGQEPRLKNYVCLHELSNINNSNKLTYKNGYIYLYFGENSIEELIEYISSYSYKNNLFDVITWTEFFKQVQDNNKIIKGTGHLNYYMFNSLLPNIPYEFNGMYTL
jgi:hypothetical protein